MCKNRPSTVVAISDQKKKYCKCAILSYILIKHDISKHIW